MKKHKFLITGSTGFIGSVLLRTLLKKEANVDIILRKQSKLWRIHDLLDKVNIHYSDLSSLSDLKKIIKKSQPTIIYHLATNGAYSYQNNANQIIQTNILGTWNLLQACNQVDYDLFVNTGSSSEYGFKEFAMRETDLVEPASYYAVTKCAQTLLCSHIAKQENRPIVTLRPFSVYGPFEEPKRLVPTLMMSLLKNKKMNLVSPTIARDYIYVDDVVSAYLKTDQLKKNSGEYFNIGTGIQTTIKEIADESTAVSGEKGNFIWGGLNNRKWDTDVWVGDISKSKRLLDWKPEYSLNSGINETWKWFKKNHYRYNKSKNHMINTVMKKNEVKCAICNTLENCMVLYSQNYKNEDFNSEIFSARRLPDRIHYQLVKCNDCGLVRSTPVVENDFLNKLYVKSKLNYSKEVENLKKTYIENLLPILNKLSKKAAILEVGCGNGFVLEELRKLGYKNAFGIEPSVDAVSKSPKILSKRIINDYFKDNLFKENTFDFIFLFQTLDHIPNPNSFLKECYRILRPNGYIFAYNHDVESFSAKILGEKSPIFDIEHTFLYSANTIKKIFKKNNFEIDSVVKPTNILSLKHLLWLLPISNHIKEKLLNKNFSLFNINFKIPLGNIAITARKK